MFAEIFNAWQTIANFPSSSSRRPDAFAGDRATQHLAAN
jgi:hypothetical protein